MLHPLNYSLPGIPVLMFLSLFYDSGGPIEIKFLNLFNFPLKYFLIHAFLLVGLTNHFHSLNILGLAPLGHCSTTVTPPEHPTYFFKGLVLISGQLFVV